MDKYITDFTNYINSLPSEQQLSCLRSQENFFTRCNYIGTNKTKVRVREGDICYIDFGMAYDREVGFLHFGLVYKILGPKALVLPITSKGKYYNEYHLAIGNVKPLVKPAYLMLNDLKTINMARIIDVKGHLALNSHCLKELKPKLQELIN